MALVQIAEHPFEFFLEALARALKAERVQVTPDAHIYVARLLLQTMTDGRHPSETLGDRVARASEEINPLQRQAILREVGDMALIFCGLWWEWEFRPRRPSHAAYHLDLGRWAYRHLDADPFLEISEKFRGLVDALIRLGTEHSLATARDVMRLYRLWEETHSPHAAKALAGLGLIVGNSGSKIPS